MLGASVVKAYDEVHSARRRASLGKRKGPAVTAA